LWPVAALSTLFHPSKPHFERTELGNFHVVLDQRAGKRKKGEWAGEHNGCRPSLKTVHKFFCVVRLIAACLLHVANFNDALTTQVGTFHKLREDFPGMLCLGKMP